MKKSKPIRVRTGNCFYEVTGWRYFDQINWALLRNGALYAGSWVSCLDGESYWDASGGTIGENCSSCVEKFRRDFEKEKNTLTPEFFCDITGWKTYGEIDWGQMCGTDFYFGSYVTPEGEILNMDEIEGEYMEFDDSQGTNCILPT